MKLGKLGGCTFLEYKRLILFAEEEKLLMGQKDQFLCSPVILLKICVGYNYFHTSQLFCVILIKAIITLKKLCGLVINYSQEHDVIYSTIANFLIIVPSLFQNSDHEPKKNRTK